MRLSARRGHADYPGADVLSRTKVFLDGAEVWGCIFADEEAGEVLVFKTEGGHPVINAAGDGIETQSRRGVVKIVIGDDPA